jgi:hypothetical protein
VSRGWIWFGHFRDSRENEGLTVTTNTLRPSGDRDTSPTMRPPRIVILVLFFVASLFLFCRSISSLRRPSPAFTTVSPPKSQIHSYFSWNVPFALFPPNAVISLLDDNSTFFPARPATFGPPLPNDGLSGQLWIGSRFVDDSLQGSEDEGELGCSDTPGWPDRKVAAALPGSEKASKATNRLTTGTNKAKNSRRSLIEDGPLRDRNVEKEVEEYAASKKADDGTDDYIQQGSVQPHGSKEALGSSSHADIQSIQEAAEISGKIALISRGGCGFLDKVKWAQRRGAIALIVGDNERGGPLIQMSAHGDVSNITIPAIFASKTTAHLLSSLSQPGSFIEDIIDENGKAALKVQQYDKARKLKQTAAATTAPAPKATAPAKPAKKAKGGKAKRSQPASNDESLSRPSWFARLFHWGGASGTHPDGSRPPSSGRLDWVLVDDWNDEKDKILKNSLDRAAKGKPALSRDGFQIGVQDWRDKDLMDGEDDFVDSATGSFKPKGGDSKAKVDQAMADDGGSSVTPGSGEYAAGSYKSKKEKSASPHRSADSGRSHGGLISKIFGEDDGEDFPNDKAKSETSKSSSKPATGGPDVASEREGLWVTITPTSGASPFFDTLLILVISPLVTLTVVYALLIIRAKIRRRRWRAPKSVIDRLPVRTYHTVATTPGQTTRLPSPTSSSPTTPLLQDSSRPRPRSRTTTGVLEGGDLLRVDSGLQGSRSPSRSGHDAPPPPSEWRKYMGRQVECVVCLEEYIDGQSRVMSLPCGHEFHAECM